MLTITLYQNCIVDDTYAEVFDLWNKDANNLTAFDKYLDKLESMTIQLPDVYLTNSGTLSIDLLLYDENVVKRFEQFNYMKLADDVGSLPRFCFIDELRIVNGMAVFSYSNDVWHTYAALMSLRSSLLTHSLALNYKDFKIRDYTLPVALESTQTYTPDVNAYVPVKIPQNLQDKVNLIVEFSVYQASTPATVEFRDTFMAVVTPYSAPVSLSPAWTVGEIESVVSQLVSGMPLNKVGAPWTETLTYDFNFEIKNIYLIPETFGFFTYNWTIGDNEYYFTDKNYDYAQVYVSGSATPKTRVRDGFRFINISAAYNRTLAARNVPFATLLHEQIYSVNPLRPFLFGNLSHQISLGGRSLTPYFDLIVSIGINSFSLKLRVENQFIDITQDYNYIPPLTTITNEAFQSQKIAYELALLNNNFQLASQVIDTTNDITKTGRQLASREFKDAAQSVGGLAQRGLNIAGIVAQRDALTAPTNVVTSTQTSSTTTLDNVRAGLLAFVMDISPDVVPIAGNTDNLTLVNNAIKILGYTCNVVVDNSVFYPNETLSPNYNIVQFDAVKVTGIFSQDIAKILTRILMNGTRIWYTENTTELIGYDI